MKKLKIVKYNQFLLFCIFFQFSLILYAQREPNIWYFGWWAGLDFNSGSPVVLTNNAMHTGYSTVSVSDSLGNLLFYSNGFYIYNRNHVLMPNGIALASQGHCQPVFSVQNLQDDSLYFIFTVDFHPYPFLDPYYGLRYSILDMRLDGGLGDIVEGQKNIKIPGALRASSGLTGIRHQNNQFAWIVVRLHHPDSNFYASYLIDQNGLDTIPVYSTSSVYLNNESNSPQISVIKISPDGNKLVCAYEYAEDTAGCFEFCSFNTLTGNVTSLFIINCTQGSYGPYLPESIEFSLDNRFMYVSALANALGPNHSALFQYDATKTDSLSFKLSETLIGINKESALQLAPDGKIYGTQQYNPNSDSLCIIHNPSLQGLACNYEVNALWLQDGKYGRLGLPQFLQCYYVYPHFTGH